MMNDGQWKPTGLLPCAGGILNQSNTYYAASDFVDSLVNRMLVEKSRERG